MTEPEIPQGERVLVIAAHPDDAEFACSGTIARWVREGRTVYYVLCTSGDKGSADLEMTSDRLRVIREREQRAAAAVLGVADVFFLGYEDGMLQPTLDLRQDLAREIRRLRPDVVFCPDPTTRFVARGYINHPDHIAAGHAALDAIFPAARDRLTFPGLLAEGHEPHKATDVLMWGSTTPDVWIDISETLDVKIAALCAHESQVGHRDVAELVYTRAHQMGESAGLAYAEAFKHIALAR